MNIIEEKLNSAAELLEGMRDHPRDGLNLVMVSMIGPLVEWHLDDGMPDW